MSINSPISTSIETLPIIEAREKLLQANPDLIYGVYELVSNEKGTIQLELVQDIMTVYGNQRESGNIKIPEGCENMRIVDLKSLMGGQLSFLSGKNNSGDQNKKYVLLSNGVIEHFQDNKGNSHIVTTLRDGANVAAGQRTTTAGRNEGENLKEELERELCEEAPFLMKNQIGEYVLAIPSGINGGKEHTKKSVELWLKSKYNLDRNNERDSKLIQRFETIFTGIKYENLGDILREIVSNDRFVYYEWDNVGINGFDDKKVNLKVGNNSLLCNVWFDQANNTFEYREIRRITQMPEGCKFVGLRPSKLYLESQSQVPKPTKLPMGRNFVPFVEMVRKKVEESMQK